VALKTDKAGGVSAGAGAASSEHHEHADVYHNGQQGQPCCRLLADIAMEILPAALESKETTEESESSSSFLA
jgi:hypothetical protein